MHKLRIVYMGTPDFAVLPLQRLMEAGHQIVGVVTNPDKPAGRGQKLQESAVKKYAVAHRLPVLQPERFRDPSFLEQLRSLRADLQFVVAFKMLPEIVWNMPPFGTVNLHASLLPDYRGAAPINWAIMNGEHYSGVSTFLLKHEVDTGNIIFQQKVKIDEEMTAGELHDRLMEVGADLLLKTAEAIAEGHYPLTDQTTLLQGREPKQAPKIFKEDMKINWSWSVERIYNHIRGLSPFPAAWTELRHKVTGEVISVKLFKAERKLLEHNFPVTLDTDGKDFIRIYVKGGYIEVKELQLSGKKRMTTEAFLRGFRMADYLL
ncbi:MULTISPECIES: methionyl-tRNA formyltransferase [Sanguibacteroides]|uniref:Methionyl-tRNA formyltransferase n=1 Tax=Sanguibacteroides justesenii TaxID=1547597 RepID=A0A0C3R746_9PORP|nr:MULTISPECIES: methionyl-tRNA formyltransferase [Sanguibacteroides]KIO43777.1 methionyl-tRNA formyltransferase [Sanguibacteroides justesenii]KIO45940.1 methionyl-tRNA formyltransferase [Sanguibacteroides justesenii]PXZ44978.1 methionyl-tRNA formyltransferase [Sanguibacteroides justesenii]